MSKRLIGILLCIAAGLILTACGNKETVYQSQRHWTERTVAVVAPIGDKTSKKRLERTAKWFLDNFREAQRHNAVAIDLLRSCLQTNAQASHGADGDQRRHYTPVCSYDERPEYKQGAIPMGPDGK